MKKIFKALSILVASTALCAGIATATACSGGNGEYEGSYTYTNGYGATYGMMVKVTVKNNIITKVEDITNDDTSKQAGWVKTGWNNEAKKDVYEYKDTGVVWHEVSDGWTKYFLNSTKWMLYTADDMTNLGITQVYDKETDETGVAVDANAKYYKVTIVNKDKTETIKYVKWTEGFVPAENQTKTTYGWADSSEKNWTNHVSGLLQKYVGWSVADVLDIDVYTDYGYKFDNTTLSWVKDKTISGEPYGKDFNEALNSSGLLITDSTQGSGRLILAIQDALTK